MRIPQKRCVYCSRRFRPDPRTASSQKTCSRTACRRRRKKEAQARWRADNPDYFQGHDHYVQHKNWLAKPGHGDYLRRYRDAHPAFVAADNRQRSERRRRQRARETVLQVSDMKDAIHRREIGRIQRLQGSDMKDTIQCRLDELLRHLSSCPWSTCADMKDEMAPVPGPG